MNNILFTPYLPSSFCREFVEIKGDSSQLGMYMALALGFKPLLDDWIPKDKLSAFRKACRRNQIYLSTPFIQNFKN